MKLTLQEKIDRDMALNVSELMAATGYNRKNIKDLRTPLVCGKIRRSDFWRHLKARNPIFTWSKTIAARDETPLSSSDLLSAVDKLRAPRKSSGRQVALRPRGGFQPRSIA